MHYLCCRAVCFRAKIWDWLDGCWGICIGAANFLFLSVIKSALLVFDCSANEDGVLILDADPSVKCGVVSCRCMVLICSYVKPDHYS